MKLLRPILSLVICFAGGAAIATAVDWRVGQAIEARVIREPGAPPINVSPKSIRVIDGDTIEAAGATWRIVDLDAPETGRTARCALEVERGLKARAYLRSILDEARFVSIQRVPCSCAPGTVEGTMSCNYARLCARVHPDGRVDVAVDMQRERHGRYWPWRWDKRPPKPDWCRPEN